MSSEGAAETTRTFGSICVFCGSSSGNSEEYRAAAKELGQLFVAKGIRLVYGGGDIGLMGEIARTVNGLEGGRVLGVIPHALKDFEVTGGLMGETIVVDDMHTRKATMAKNADAFIALPGGFGTLEELFEVITWQQLGIHQKPIGVLNTHGYYDGLRQLIEHAISSGFVRDIYRGIVVFADTPAELLHKLEHHVPPTSPLGLTWSVDKV